MQWVTRRPLWSSIYLIARACASLFAESCTAGRAAATMATCEGGVVVYSAAQRVALLNVDAAKAAACNCVSEGVATAMAEGLRKLMGADVSVAITGYLDVYENVPRPYAWVAVLCPGDVVPLTGLLTLPYRWNRDLAQDYYVGKVLDFVRDRLSNFA